MQDFLRSADIRSRFFAFFADRGHTVVPSAPLVPGNDPTLLFTNAGMVQFKDVFLGADQRSYQRAVSSQRCLRAGGKHNDLDQVGYTARHHTFFEMLGNFSFGDYFKTEAIRYAWELLTEVYGLPAERLFVTVFEDDDEAEAIWRDEIGVPADRIARIGAKDNFWSMGDTGPCGPCSEIFYDHGADIPGGPPGSPDEDGDRFIEIWNLVFMQFDRAADGELKPLPKPCVDTGMGLERLAAILQGVHNNYDTDLFQPLIKAAAELTGCTDLQQPSLKVLADHIRACAFLLADGVLPGNEGRGYVLRRIIRRAIRHGHQLGAEEVFFWRLFEPLQALMSDAYPELVRHADKIRSHLHDEEVRFRETLERGMELLRGVLESSQSDQQVPGDIAFKLYDTYGFPLDLTQDVAREHGLTVDVAGFDAQMQAQRERARAANRFQQNTSLDSELLQSLPVTSFLGYEQLQDDHCRVLALLRDGQQVQRLEAGEEAVVILDRTPFYAESGGQVGDTGTLTSAQAEFVVSDTRKHAGRYHLHHGELSSGVLQPGDVLHAAVQGPRRADIVRHHSATHLLHAALRQVLGEHVEQKGSLVAADRLRFDFSHPQAVSAEQLEQIEALVNDEIRANVAVDIREMPLQQALEAGAMALFDEKYDDQVRVLRFGDFSIELCGGTHVSRAGDIGAFKIVNETGIAAGVRRIEAVAGGHAIAQYQQLYRQQSQLAQLLKASPEQLLDKTRQLQARVRELQAEIHKLQSDLASGKGGDLLAQAETLAAGGARLVVANVGDMDAKIMREQIDQLKARDANVIVLLAASSDGKVRLAAGVGDAQTGSYHAGKLVNHVAAQIGGKGGGRADFAQAGGTEINRLDDALKEVRSWLESNS
ncbi:MAG: alanine--tRNA ligase [Gammaproteobacteria bacterium]|nr:alanine--tRNA ligase [Gammaproteobacteria bacterium]